MNKPGKAQRWYQPWHRAEVRAQDDPADLGTCFGLEVSLGAAAVPAKTEAAPRRLSWMQRFTARRRTAA